MIIILNYMNKRERRLKFAFKGVCDVKVSLSINILLEWLEWKNTRFQLYASALGGELVLV